ncbi:probable WRKY transcription factor protein 1 [Centruroides vittatus]|uniref:probable WRKY transcription factor protein 1 n=1 Tax=Centruroides vittatus TaxID=120091 RepID=UPI0035109D46
MIYLRWIATCFIIIIPCTIQVKAEDLAPNVTTTDDNSTNADDGVAIINNSTSHDEDKSENNTTVTTQSSNATNLESNNTSNSIEITEISILQDENSTDLVHANVTDEKSVNNEDQDFNLTKPLSSSAANNDRCSNLGNPNDYVDNLIESIVKNSSGEINLPSKYGFFTLTNGRMWDLTNARRIGDAEVTCTNISIVIQALLRYEDAKAVYTWRRKSLLSTWKGKAFLRVDKIDIQFGIIQNNTGTYLHYFKIKDMSGINVEFTGLTYVTWALSRLTNSVINNFRRTASVIIEGSFKEAFAIEIRRMNFPLA